MEGNGGRDGEMEAERRNKDKGKEGWRWGREGKRKWRDVRKDTRCYERRRQKVGEMARERERNEKTKIHNHISPFIPYPNASFSHTFLFFHPSPKLFLSASPTLNYELLEALNIRYLSLYEAARCRYKDTWLPFKVHYKSKDTQLFTVAICYRSFLTLTS